MTSDKTSADKSFILEYVQLFVLENDDSITEKDFSSHIGNLGNILMPLTETWNSESLEKGENGFFIQFEQESDAVGFAISLLDKTRENNDFEVGVAIHSGGNISLIEKEIEKLISLEGPNKIVVSELISLHENQEFSYTLVKAGKIKSEASENEFDVFTIDLLGKNQIQKGNIFQNFNVRNLKWEYVIPVVLLVCAWLFFLLPKEKPEPTIAVWMMENKGSSEDDFWVWGITEDITKKLGLFLDIKIVQFDEIATAFSSEDSPEETAKRFGMNYVLISDFNQVENGVELHYSLINVKNGKSEYYKKLIVSSKQVHEIVGILSRKILSSLNVDDVEFTKSRKSINSAAYELYLKGKYSIKKGKNSEQIDQGIKLLEESIKLDDNFLLAKSFLADINRNEGNLSKARDLYMEAMTKAGEKGDKHKVREYLVSLGDILLEMNEFPNALECYKNAFSLAEELSYRKNNPHIMNQIALIHNELEEPDSAVFYLEKSIKLSHDLNDSLNTVSELLFLGNLYYTSGDFYNALIQFGKSLEYSKRIKDTTAISRALHHMSDIYWIKKDFTQALSHQGDLLALLINGGDKSSIAWSSFRMGSMYENKCDYGLAEKYLKQSLEIRKKLNNKEDIAEVMGYLGIVSLNSGNYIKAQKYFTKSQKIYEELGNRSGLGFMNHNLGESYFYRGKPEKSERYFRRALTIWRELGDPSMEIWSLSWLVLAEMKSGNREFEVDLYILNKMLKQNETAPEDIPVVHYNLYLVYDKKKIEEEAGYHLNITYDEIMARTESLQSDDDKNSFLTKNPLNRKIVKAWEEKNL